MRCIDLDVIHAHSPFVSGLEAQRLGRRRNVPVIACSTRAITTTFTS
jgi:hypothetical protein